MKDIVNFIHELGLLKLMKRTGFWVHGVKDPDSIADHMYRAAVIGYIIAKIEKADADKVARMIMFHDIPETRISDMHKIVSRYVDKKDGEERAVKDQSELLPEEIADEYVSLMEEFEKRKSKEAIIAKDVDLLELAFQAKEIAESGNKSVINMFERTGQELRTDTAKKIYESLKTEKGHWWDGLKKDSKDAYWD